AFSPDGTRIVSGSDDRTVRIWDATTGTQIGNPLHGHDDSVQSVAFSPDGTRIVSGSDDRTVRVWDVTTGTQIGDSHHNDDVWSVAFLPDNTRSQSGLVNTRARIWNILNGCNGNLSSLRFNESSQCKSKLDSIIAWLDSSIPYPFSSYLDSSSLPQESMDS
ncbi:hypothetical protein GYMLUDRAFT_245403, partial [Collybiopsis luxurians FD-317 M1]